MNELTHLMTGYFLARLFKSEKTKHYYKHDEYITMFVTISACLPDLTEFYGDHATWTHTILFASLIGIAYALIIYLAGKDFFKNYKLSLKRIIFLGWISCMSHLFLDIFTHQDFQCVEAVESFKHIYFWPFWYQSFHLDCLFGWNRLVRTLIEVFYTVFLVIVIIYRWKFKDENIFDLFNPNNWLKYINNTNSYETKDRKDVFHKIKIQSKLLWILTVIPAIIQVILMIL